MSDKKERNELGEPDNIVDMGDLHGNPIPSAVDDAADVMSQYEDEECDSCTI